MLRRLLILIGIIGVALGVASSAQAHANLYHSNPVANAVLEVSPPEIRLWFTESLEADFSSFSLRDRDGIVIETPPSQLDSSDSQQLFMRPDRLPDGLYTVSWRVVSAADGHQTRGSFVFTIGEPIVGIGATTSHNEPIPTDSATIRWLNLISLALLIGSVGFWLFVWQPVFGDSQPAVENRMRKLIWVGWWLVGWTSLLLLLLQIAQATGHAIFSPIHQTVLDQVVTQTRFGRLWLARNGLWVLVGVILLLAKHDRRFYWNALVLGGVVLLTQSLFSHASAAQKQTEAVAADWLHLWVSTLWVGGLVQFINVVGPVRRESNGTDQLGKLVGYFSNMARVTVMGLIITGTYAAWLQVGSLDGFLDTQYGQALLVKLLLLLPLLGIAGINLILTQRGLQQGQKIWAGRLQGLIGFEITLACGILIAVGVMTAIAPARGVIELRDAQVAVSSEPPPDQIVETQIADGLSIQLDIRPGYVGQNTFTVLLTNLSGKPIEDASLIRLRFENQSENLGQSELRPTHRGDGAYTIVGSNLSTPGAWQIRLSVQRPDEFDTVVDFNPQVSLPPAPLPPPPLPDDSTPLPYQSVASLLTGLIALGFGGLVIGQNRRQWRRGEGLVAGGLIMVGAILLVSGAIGSAGIAEPSTKAAAFNPAPSAPVRMIFTSSATYPYLLTADGVILRPIESDAAEPEWQTVPLDTPVNDLYVDPKGVLWAATDKGLRVNRDGNWETVDDVPSQVLEMTHGYLFSMGMGEIMRGPDHWMLLDVPLPDQPTGDLVMMGNHTHILQNGDQLFQTPDLGLGWKPINAPAPVKLTWLDEDGNLIAVTEQGVYRWNYADGTWSEPLPLPENQSIDVIRQFNGRFYVVAGGKFYGRASGVWQVVELPDATNAYFYGLGMQYPGTLWVLDSSGAALWSSTDAETWTKIEVIQLAP
ncbi:MAG: copper resistance protein CopC [Chloroflexi bacterium]|nr:copper resistance protein CopC [Chloroflexota bacterium]